MPTLPAITITEVSPVKQRNDVLAYNVNDGPILLDARHLRQLRSYELMWKGLTAYQKNELEYFITTTVQFNILPWSFTHPHGQTITNATNATPIVVTTSYKHGYFNHEWVTISGVEGNTAANGTWQIYDVAATTFKLRDSVGNGTFADVNNDAMAKLFLRRVLCITSEVEFKGIEKILGPDSNANGIWSFAITLEEIF